MADQTEQEFLHQYDPNSFDRPNVLVDTVIFTVIDNKLKFLTVKRANHPCKNQWSLVGGFIDIHNDQDLEATALRKLKEKTGVDTPYLEQLGSFGNAKRDPRGWSVTNVFFALIPNQNIELQVGIGATDIKWSEVDLYLSNEKLSFDHNQLLLAALERLRSKVLYTTLPVHLMNEQFTLRDLQNIYEIIMDQKMDHKSFRRRILSANILEETGEMSQERGRPAAFYRVRTNETHYFLRNIEGGRKN